MKKERKEATDGAAGVGRGGVGARAEARGIHSGFFYLKDLVF